MSGPRQLVFYFVEETGALELRQGRYRDAEDTQGQVLGLVSASWRLTGLGAETDPSIIVICLRKHDSAKMCWVTLFSLMYVKSCCLGFGPLLLLLGLWASADHRYGTLLSSTLTEVQAWAL